MARHFNAASGLYKQVNAGERSTVEVLFKAIAQIENFDETIDAFVVGVLG
jgi:hypothetical protein